MCSFLKELLPFLTLNNHSYSHLDFTIAGADPRFQVGGGAHLKKLRRAVSRVKNHDFTPKNHIFFNVRAGCAAPPPGSAPE